jgi:UDP-N-acetylmuramyl pentapeptide phosphotransferase/UDP-N-acetylglucosamine-1-phosphate transferase
MEFETAFSQINWLSVVVAALASFAIGSLWYSSVLFGKAWQAEIKLSDEEIKKTNMPLIFGLSFVLSFIATFVFAMFIGKEATWSGGLIAGLLVSVAWIGTAFGVNYLFARRTLKLFLIDAGYFVVFFSVMGLILGAW